MRVPVFSGAELAFMEGMAAFTERGNFSCNYPFYYLSKVLQERDNSICLRDSVVQLACLSQDDSFYCFPYYWVVSKLNALLDYADYPVAVPALQEPYYFEVEVANAWGLFN